jgi:hypothetical protein
MRGASLLRQIASFVWAAVRQIAVWLIRALRWAVPRLFRLLGRFLGWMSADPLRQRVGLVGIVIVGVYVGYRVIRLIDIALDPRSQTFAAWWTGSQEERSRLVTAQRTACPGAPFILPADGYIGLLYGDPRGPYSESQRHQGIDVFSPTGPGETPVYAAYDGYVSRADSWTSAVIQRVPDDPLQPGRQIWLYYTHMAPADGETDFIEESFPRGVSEVFVRQGTLLGYAGNYSGTLNPVGVHLHFSIVRDDGYGGYTNELFFDNTIDPSRYLGLPVNYGCAPDVPACAPDPLCAEAILGAGGG